MFYILPNNQVDIRNRMFGNPTRESAFVVNDCLIIAFVLANKKKWRSTTRAEIFAVYIIICASTGHIPKYQYDNKSIISQCYVPLKIIVDNFCDAALMCDHNQPNKSLRLVLPNYPSELFLNMSNSRVKTLKKHGKLWQTLIIRAFTVVADVHPHARCWPSSLSSSWSTSLW